MATLSDAEAARAVHASRLARGGAHAIGIERVQGRRTRESWVVVAHVEPGAARDLPHSVSIDRGSRRVRVPVRVEESEEYQLE